MKKMDGVMKFRCACGEVMELTLQGYDMKEMIEEGGGHELEASNHDRICPKCDRCFNIETEISVKVSAIDC